MKQKFLISCFLILIITPHVIFSQKEITVTKPRLEIFEDKLIIYYDILDASPSDFFRVWIEVVDTNGNQINAISVTGDIGTNIKGGLNKRIIWDLILDKVYIDNEIIVKVKAENSTDEVKAKVKEDATLNLSDISKTGMILSSVPLPGLGQSILKKGKPYWLIGITGYGCLAGSVILNHKAATEYDAYKLSIDPDESNEYFDNAVRYDQYSRFLAYSAIGIWAADLIWVMVTPAKEKRLQSLYLMDRKLKIIPFYDTDSNTTMMSLTYRF